MKNKFTKLIIAIIVLSSLTVTNEVSAGRKGFQDVSIFFWAHPYIEHLDEIGSINGFEDGTFGIGKNVTRAQASKIIVESLKFELVTLDKPKFSDVDQNHWAKKYIETLSSKGIIDGFEDGTFKPDEKLTRGQMAKLLANSFGLTQQSTKPFKDISKGHWAYEYIMKLAESGMTTGYDDQTYRSENAVTREEMAVFVSRGIAKRDGITLREPAKKPANQTNKNPYDKTLNDPINQLPIGATFKDYDRAFHNFYYEKKLPGGGTVTSVSVNAFSGKKTVYIFGKDINGIEYTGIYEADELDIKYAYKLPELTSDAYGEIYDLAGDFAIAYGWQDVYQFIEMNIIYDEGVQYYGSNTNAITLGEEFDQINRFAELPIILKQMDGGRVIYSYNSQENNDEYKWVIFSESCEGGVCPENVDLIKIDRYREFRIVYVKR